MTESKVEQRTDIEELFTLPQRDVYTIPLSPMEEWSVYEDGREVLQINLDRSKTYELDDEFFAVYKFGTIDEVLNEITSGKYKWISDGYFDEDTYNYHSKNCTIFPISAIASIQVWRIAPKSSASKGTS